MVAHNDKKPAQPPLTYRPTQAAAAIGCNVKEIYAAIDANELPHRKGNFRGGERERYLIDAPDLRAWLDRKFPKVGAPPEKSSAPEPAPAPQPAKPRSRRKLLIHRKQDLL